MSRRVSLPGADELFRTTGGMALQPSTPRRPANGEARVPAPAGESDAVAAEDAPQSVPAQGGDGDGAEHVAADAESVDAGESRSRAAAAERSARRQGAQEGSAGASASAAGGSAASGGAASAAPRKRGRQASRRPSGRERHDEKITVYVSAEELMDLEHARLVLRGEHGLAVDRGRIVREAVAVVLADLESRGDASILVRRLRGR
ncbi:hypothetical protein EJ357_10110 [Streptomyces cyaneochromogenes]|uniref:Cobyrinic acid a,c-diamide synthase n=1 Tax=Streptomyces cyaneochromogenes TaxID=2496836 RepID=A0A3S9M3T7_9ACTN|nr:hypothetical protein [Streptomyces cyaneochromogenes]AZQ33782.1 hypothetical protein EJ357_10110 [Streptomyces cyaneochromogenes]